VPLAIAWPLTCAEENDPTPLSSSITDELQKIMNVGRVRDLNAATPASNSGVTETPQPVISALPNRLLKDTVAET
jgi:hypothetical protein